MYTYDQELNHFGFGPFLAPKRRQYVDIYSSRRQNVTNYPTRRQYIFVKRSTYFICLNVTNLSPHVPQTYGFYHHQLL